ncbi:hypothetical protein CBR_g40426 [Chara braunii]|uniref:Uncharacterized protein n=1 Tax=Chara braunii TaxID=69332 RepID=A0A388LTQ3_CHABU|nr:hypothetical protein CBR_g40426 [Chara braunii]|eukprot:GBG85696.1 hypothetical protein CBR_g40426 [Chara braunii]
MFMIGESHIRGGQLIGASGESHIRGGRLIGASGVCPCSEYRCPAMCSGCGLGVFVSYDFMLLWHGSKHCNG